MGSHWLCWCSQSQRLPLMLMLLLLPALSLAWASCHRVQSMITSVLRPARSLVLCHSRTLTHTARPFACAACVCAHCICVGDIFTICFCLRRGETKQKIKKKIAHTARSAWRPITGIELSLTLSHFVDITSEFDLAWFQHWFRRRCTATRERERKKEWVTRMNIGIYGGPLYNNYL